MAQVTNNQVELEDVETQEDEQEELEDVETQEDEQEDEQDSKTEKGTSLAGSVPVVEQVGEYLGSSKTLEILNKHFTPHYSKRANKMVTSMPQTTLNNLAYKFVATKGKDGIEAITINGTFLFKESSVIAYIDVMKSKQAKKQSTSRDNQVTNAIKKWGKLKEKLEQKAIEVNPDLLDNISKANKRIRIMLHKKEVPNIEAILQEEKVNLQV